VALLGQEHQTATDTEYNEPVTTKIEEGGERIIKEENRGKAEVISERRDTTDLRSPPSEANLYLCRCVYGCVCVCVRGRACERDECVHRL
jgi:hypothetical protein